MSAKERLAEKRHAMKLREAIAREKECHREWCRAHDYADRVSRQLLAARERLAKLAAKGRKRAGGAA